MLDRFVARRAVVLAGIFVAFTPLTTLAQLAPMQAKSGPSIAVTAAVKAPKADAPKPDTLIFTNGDTLTGQFLRAVGGNVTFHSDLLNLDITVPWDKIRELHSTKSVVVLPVGQRVTKKTPDSSILRGSFNVADKQVTVVPAAGSPQIFPTAKVAHVLDTKTFERELHRTPSYWRGWNGNMNIGATVVTATQDSQTFSGGFALYRAIPGVSFLPLRNRTSFGFTGSYGRISQPQAKGYPALPDLKTEVFHANSEHDRYFSARFYALAQSAFDHNYAQGLDLQQIYGGGIGWTALKSPKQQMDVKATIQYERQTFLPSHTAPGLDLVGSTYTLAYLRKLPNKAIYNQQLLVIPAYNNESALSLSENQTLAVPVYKRLSVVVSTLDSYLYDPPKATAPAPANQRNSFQFSTGISYSLR